MKRIIFGLFILVCLLGLSNLALADMMPGGYKSVSYCFIIENQKDYSDYGFISHGYPMGQWEIINPGECVHFYKYSSPTVYAFKMPVNNENLTQKISETKDKILNNESGIIEQKSNELFNKIKTGEIKLSADEAKRFKPWIVVPNPEDPLYEDSLRHYTYMKTQEDEFAEQSGIKLISSGLSLHNYGTVSEYDPLKSAQEVLTVKAVNDQLLILEKEKIIYTYEDGMTEEKYYSAGQTDFPEPSKTTILPPWTNTALFLGGVVISLAALVTIVVILVKRHRK